MFVGFQANYESSQKGDRDGSITIRIKSRSFNKGSQRNEKKKLSKPGGKDPLFHESRRSFSQPVCENVCRDDGHSETERHLDSTGKGKRSDLLPESVVNLRLSDITICLWKFEKDINEEFDSLEEFSANSKTFSKRRFAICEITPQCRKDFLKFYIGRKHVLFWF